MSAPREPSANDAVQAVATARRVLPAASPQSRVELVAFAALAEAFPGAQRSAIAELLGLEPSWEPQSSLDRAQRQAWWREDLINEVVGVLVAPFYGERAL